MPLEFSSITNIVSALSRRRYQRANRFAVNFSRFSRAFEVALSSNGLAKRDFQDHLVHRTQTVKVPDQSAFTTDVKGPGGFDYQAPYQYSVSPDVNITVINDQFDRMRNVFVDWLRISTGIGSDGALAYRSQTSCDFSIIALGENGVPLCGYTAQDTIIKSVDGTSFDMSSDTLVNFTVSMSCRRLQRLNGTQAALAFSSFI